MSLFLENNYPDYLAPKTKGVHIGGRVHLVPGYCPDWAVALVRPAGPTWRHDEADC